MTGIIAALAAELPATREARACVDEIRAMDGTPKHAWTDADAQRARTGHYNAHEGSGWQPCTGSIPVAASTARDDAARLEQRQHRAEVMHRIHDTGEALIAYAEAHGG
jgi:hypothetical protein